MRGGLGAGSSGADETVGAGAGSGAGAGGGVLLAGLNLRLGFDKIGVDTC